jgi:hypothetical protein
MPFGGGPGFGQVLPSFLQEVLKLTDEQKKQLADLQKDVDGKLAKLLSEEQNKQLKSMREGFGRMMMPFGPPAGPGGPASGPPSGPPTAEPRGLAPKDGPSPPPAERRPAEQSDGKPGGAAPRPVPAPAGDARQPRADVFIGGPPSNSPVSQAQADLKAVLSQPSHTAEEVKEKVAAVRLARQKARQELDAAIKDLQQLLTAEQEAVLVSLGYLE